MNIAGLSTGIEGTQERYGGSKRDMEGAREIWREQAIYGGSKRDMEGARGSKERKREVEGTRDTEGM